MAVKTNIEAVREALAEEMRRDNRIIVMGEDVGLRGGVFRATDGLHQEFGEMRVLDTPLAESGIVAAAIGMAINGLRPVAEIQFADYITPAMEQIISEAARLRYRSNNGYAAPMVIRTPYGGGVHGALFHSQSVEAFFTHVPGLKVLAPSTPYDIKGLLKAAIRDDDPVLFFEHKKTYRSIRGEVPEGDYVLPIGKAYVRKPGTHLTIIAYGMMMHNSLEVAAQLEKQGISVEVIDLPTLKPLDEETILASVRKTGRALMVYEDNLFGGYGAEVAAMIGEKAFEYLDAPVRRLAAPDVPAMPFAAPMEEFFLIKPQQIADAAKALMKY